MISPQLAETPVSQAASTLEVGGRQFLRNGQPHRILSGALHYFRVVPEYWEDRLLKYRALGLNTVETYVAWNLHEPRPGSFSFEGALDLRRFITLAGSLGLDVILRPGPYICAEWDLGGLPAWLLADRSMRLRTLHKGFTAAVSRYFDHVIAEVKDLQCSHGGPIVAVQIENEYGSYGNSKAYLRWLETALVERGINSLLFTSDGPLDSMLQGGTLNHVLKTVNFGTRSAAFFEKLSEYDDGPPMCMEFWNGWFDHWGEEHHIRNPQDTVATLDEMLTLGGSVNFYMMHGGTNFGFMNGANHEGKYQPTVTSYDYDAPLNEQGEPTAKFFEFQKILARHGAKPSKLPPANITAAYGDVPLSESVCLFDTLESWGDPIRCEDIPTMEEVGQNYGFILYRTFVTGPRTEELLYLRELRDRAVVLQDGRFVAIVDRNEIQQGIPITVPEEGTRIDILVENQGRVNYGPALHDRKGITTGVHLKYQFLSGWDVFPLEFDFFPPLAWAPLQTGRVSTFYRGSISIDELADTFLKVEGTHGIAWINGFCLGRFWDIGPQKTLYVPKHLLRSGTNEIVIFEAEGTTTPQVSLVDTADLGSTIKEIS